MNYLSLTFQNKKEKGFMTLVPVLIITSLLFLLLYSNHERNLNLSYSISRYESFVDAQFKKKSCQNLKVLYISYDPNFLINC